jgi:asparagine synthetase B (glutamine-hydrolysing)
VNLFFGLVSKTGTDFDKIKTKVKVLSKVDVSSYTNEKGNICCGYISNEGVIIGHAEDNGIFFIYIGSFYKPMPGWGVGSPLDNPHLTANFLLQRYKEKGKMFMDNVLGSYAFFLFDGKKNQTMVGSDPDGFRKIYYSYQQETFYFSTSLIHMKCLFETGAKLNRSFEDFLLGYEFLPFKQTIVKDVYNLTNGEIINLTNADISTIKIKKGMVKENGVDSNIRNNISEAKLIELLYESFTQSIEELCPTNSPIAVMLGGFDSALIASILKKKGYSIETFTFHFDDNRYNQSHVNTLKQYLGIKHNWVHIDSDLIKKGINSFSLAFNQITSLPHYIIQTEQVCQQMRKSGFLHCLTGDGCDEVFLGYPSVYKRAKLFMSLGEIPKPVTAALSFLLSLSFLERFLGHPIRFLRNFVNIAKRNPLERGHISNRTFDEVSLKRLRLGRMPNQAVDVETILSSLVIGLETLSPLRLAYHGKSMPGLNKSKHEGASNSAGVSIHSPFLHPRIQNFAKNLPESLLRPKNKPSDTGKYILMQMAEKYNLLPSEIIYQKKASPVASPVDHWYSGILKKFILEFVKELPFEYDNYYIERLLKPKFTEKLFREHISIGSNTSNAVAVLLTYASFTKYIKAK